MMSGTPPERTPPKPDPRITPTTMKGNYPAQYKTFTRTLLKCSACGATMWKHGGAMACLSYECQPKTKPPNRPPPPPRPPRGPSRATGLKAKQFNEPPTFWQSMLAYALRFIDWLNGEAPIEEDDKHMPDGGEMATFAELFEEVEQVKEKPRPPRPAQNPGNTSTSR